jgi:hypothetical protein
LENLGGKRSTPEIAPRGSQPALWHQVRLGQLATANGTLPACLLDVFEHVYLRGQLSLSAVAAGGMLLGAFPLDAGCPCTPQTTRPVYASTTGLSRGLDAHMVPVICVVRLELSSLLPIDVDADGLITINDTRAITRHPKYASAFCGIECGRADVNRDGLVSVEDVHMIQQSVTHLPWNVSCGGIFATEFACGVARSAPPSDLYGVSLDSIEYFRSEQTYVLDRQSHNRTARDIISPELTARLANLESELQVVAQEHRQHANSDARLKRELESVERELASVKTDSSRTSRWIGIIWILIFALFVLMAGRFFFNR